MLVTKDHGDKGKAITVQKTGRAGRKKKKFASWNTME